MAEKKTKPDECQNTAPPDEAELERQRREKDHAWEEQEARRRREEIDRRVHSNWRNRWL